MTLSVPQARPSAPAAPGWLAGGRIPSLDGLRAAAIVMVLFAHAHFPGDDLLPLRAFRGRCGFLGVQLFFVLSGFLITTLMLREVAATGRMSLRQFYARRALRIVPAYAAYLLVLAALQLLGHARLSGRHWLALGTYTVNFLPAPIPWQISHIWSLSVEEHFYLLWPLLVAAWPLARCRRAAVACIIGGLALRWALLLAYPAGAGAIDLLTFTRLDDIAVGCLLAFAARDPAWRGRLDAFVSRGWCLALLLAAFLASQVCFSNVVGARLFPPVVLKLVLGLANDANSLTIALLLWAALARPQCAAGRLLNHPVACAVGVMSYSLYLWHPLFFEAKVYGLGAFPLNVVGSFAAAGLSYLLIERPFLSLKERLSARAKAGGEEAPRGGRRWWLAGLRGRAKARACPAAQPEPVARA
jgi:peptidoglycan/LPS O-acetylase OafA/YrhL